MNASCDIEEEGIFTAAEYNRLPTLLSFLCFFAVTCISHCLLLSKLNNSNSANQKMKQWAFVSWNDGSESTTKVDELFCESAKAVGSIVQARFLNPEVSERATNKYVMSTGTIKSFHGKVFS